MCGFGGGGVFFNVYMSFSKIQAFIKVIYKYNNTYHKIKTSHMSFNIYTGASALLVYNPS